MNMQPVQSSQIASVGYDAATKTLAVKFQRGATYHYRDVPPEVHEEMMRANSIGQFFGARIRAGGFEYERQPEERQE